MSIGLNANLDGTGSVQISGSDAIQLSTGLAATFVNNVSIAGTASVTGNLSFNSGYGSAAVAYGCRAWVNFNGTGTVAIRASGNVTSITDNGTGDYTVNFTTAMPDANYSIATNSGTAANNPTNTSSFAGTPTTTTSRITVYDSANANVDRAYVSAIYFR